MDLFDTVMLLAAGLGAGVVNAVAGGGSLITFPTLVALGLSPVAANVTNSVAVSPGYVTSVYGGRNELFDLTRHGSRSRLAAMGPARARYRDLLALLATASAGGALGCLVLLASPERAFELAVPFLVLGATAVLAAQPRLRRYISGRSRSRAGARPAGTAGRRLLAVHAVVGLGAIYGGYFGAALGVMLVAALGLVLPHTLAVVTALKNAVSAVVGLTTVVAFAIFGPVDWAYVAVLLPATAAGGYAGARLARRLPAGQLRAAIVITGAVVGIALLARTL